MSALLRKNDRIRFTDYLPIIIVVVLMVVIVCFNLIYTRFYVVGSSMEGTITGADNDKVKGGDYVYTFKGTPARGDIVVVNVVVGEVTDENGQTKPVTRNLIKRVIGLFGDTVELRGGVLYLNGKVKEEPYVSPEHNDPDNTKNNFGPVTVQKGKMFLMGDNRNDSNDSRSDTYGQIPLDCVVGIVAEWSLVLSDAVTDFNTFFDFTVLPLFKTNNF